jgi:hypothetical protein
MKIIEGLTCIGGPRAPRKAYIMNIRTTLTTALLGLTLTAALSEAGPKARTAPPVPTAPPSASSRTQRFCQALGTFAYNWALDREDGVLLLAALNASRLWDRQHDTDEDTRALHDDIIIALYNVWDIHPVEARTRTSTHCLQSLTEPSPSRY